MKKTVWDEISSVGFMLQHIYKELVEMSELIEYRYPEGCAGDDLKGLASALMEEIERIYPTDY